MNAQRVTKDNVRVGDLVQIQPLFAAFLGVDSTPFTIGKLEYRGDESLMVYPLEDRGPLNKGVYHGALTLISNSVIDDQTVHFWNLQLQFMAMSTADLGVISLSYMFGGVYSRNERTKKSYELAVKAQAGHWLTDDEHNCLATHLALNLSGLA